MQTNWVAPTLLAKVPRASTHPAGKVYIASKNASMIAGQQMEIEDEAAAAVLEIDLHEGEIVDNAVAPTPEQDTGTRTDNKLPAKWVTAASHKEIQKAIDAAPNATCCLCSYKCTSRKRILLHARLHFVHSFCRCGCSSKWRETIRKHQTNACNT